MTRIEFIGYTSGFSCLLHISPLPTRYSYFCDRCDYATTRKCWLEAHLDRHDDDDKASPRCRDRCRGRCRGRCGRRERPRWAGVKDGVRVRVKRQGTREAKLDYILKDSCKDISRVAEVKTLSRIIKQSFRRFVVKGFKLRDRKVLA